MNSIKQTRIERGVKAIAGGERSGASQKASVLTSSIEGNTYQEEVERPARLWRFNFMPNGE